MKRHQSAQKQEGENQVVTRSWLCLSDVKQNKENRLISESLPVWKSSLMVEFNAECLQYKSGWA